MLLSTTSLRHGDGIRKSVSLVSAKGLSRGNLVGVELSLCGVATGRVCTFSIEAFLAMNESVQLKNKRQVMGLGIP